MYLSVQSTSTMPPLSITKDFNFKPIFRTVEDVEMDPKLFVFQTINMASTSKEPLIPRIFIF
jgi:hypothetical protein